MLLQIRTAWTEQSVAIEKKRAELRKLEESLIKSKKDTEKQATKLKSMSTSSGNAKEAELQSEIDKCMVRCRRPVLVCHASDVLAEPPEVLHLPHEHAQHRHHEVHAL